MPSASSDKDKNFMRRALALARASLRAGGGPFGAVIVRDGQVIGEGSNCVVLKRDPTAHAEVEAIRDACGRLQTWDLSGCDIYCSCEPCPMCAGAIQWARLNKVFFAADRFAAEAAGFADRAFHEEDDGCGRRQPPLLAAEAEEVFQHWRNNPDRVMY